MSCHYVPRFCTAAAAIFICIAGGTSTVSAGSTTSRGQISVAQVKEMLDRAAADPSARQVLTAYLAGAGETAGWLLDAAADQGAPLHSCTRRLSLDDMTARRALEAGAPNPAAETAATPLIVRDMLKRAGCRLTDRRNE
jgi:hypothetical protein